MTCSTPPTRTGLFLSALAVVLAAAAPSLARQPAQGKYESPRAVVRTLLTAVVAARGDPGLIGDAVACLDLPRGAANGPQLAMQLEAILRAYGGLETGQLMAQLPDKLDEPVYPLSKTPEYHLVLARRDDGRWAFDRATVAEIPRMWADLRRAQQGRPPEPQDFNQAAEFASPQATFQTFLEAFSRDDLDGAAECLDLRTIPYVARREVGLELAAKLKQVLDRNRLVVFQEIPSGSGGESYFWLQQPEGVIELSRLNSGERKGEWLFSRSTVKTLERLHDYYASRPPVSEVTDFANFKVRTPFWSAPGAWLSVRLPDWLRVNLLATRTICVKLYQVLGLALLVVLTGALYRLLPRLIAGPLRRLLRPSGLETLMADPAGRLRPISVFLCALFLRFGLLLLGPDRAVLVWVLGVLNPLLLVLLAWALFRVLDLVVAVGEARLVAAGRSVAATHMLLPVLSLVIKIGIFVFVLFRILDLFDWNVTALLTGLGIGGVAFALGAQDSIKNFFGSLTLIADRPFVVGELIKVGANEGVVEVLGLRSTRIRAPDGTRLTIPNSDLATLHIANFGSSNLHGYKTRLALVYTTPPERLIAFRDGIRRLILEHPQTRKDGFEVFVHELSSTAIELLVKVTFEVRDRQQELEARDAFLLGIVGLAESLGVEFAFPKGTGPTSPSRPPAAPAQPPDGTSARTAAAARTA